MFFLAKRLAYGLNLFTQWLIEEWNPCYLGDRWYRYFKAYKFILHKVIRHYVFEWIGTGLSIYFLILEDVFNGLSVWGLTFPFFFKGGASMHHVYIQAQTPSHMFPFLHICAPWYSEMIMNMIDIFPTLFVHPFAYAGWRGLVDVSKVIKTLAWRSRSSQCSGHRRVPVCCLLHFCHHVKQMVWAR